MNQNILMIVLIVAYVAFLYYFVFGKRKKEKKRLDEINKSLKPGDRIVTISGLCCTVTEMPNEREVIVDLSAAPDKHIKARMLRGAIKDLV